MYLKTVEGAEAMLAFRLGPTFIKEIKVVTAIFKSGSIIILALTDGQLALAATDNTKSMLKLIGEPDPSFRGSGSLIINPQTLIGVISNRGEVEFSYKQNVLHFKGQKGSRYSGQFSTQLPIPEVLDDLNQVFNQDLSGINLNKRLFNLLEEGIKYCDLNDTYSEGRQDYVRHLSCDGRQLKIVTYDHFHSAIWKQPISMKRPLEFNLAVYQSYFTFIHSLAQQQQFSLAITDSLFCVKNDTFFLSLPPVQIDEEEFTQFSASLEEMIVADKAFKARLEISALATVTNNLQAMFEKGARIEITGDQDELNLLLVTEIGKMEDSVKVKRGKGQGKVDIDALPLKDVLRCTPKQDCLFSFMERRAYFLDFNLDNDATLHYAVTAMQ